MGIISKLKNVLGIDSNGVSRGQDEYSPSIPTETSTTTEQPPDTTTTVPDVEETEPVITDEPPEDPVDTIKGIGPSYAEELATAGIETVRDLANADATTIAKETDIAEARLQNWIERANSA